MSKEITTNIHPKEVASKASKKNLKIAIEMSLEVESEAVRLNTQTFNKNRYTAIAKIKDYDKLKDKARRIKEKSIENLPLLIEQLTKVIEERGGNVFLTRTKEEATDYIKNICEKHNAKLVVKAKSITSEEIGLNKVLEKAGIEVAETDLAEFILQVSKEQPSHNVAPAIHRSRERITELFKEHFNTQENLDTGEDLTKFARDILREKFLKADIGISGANILAADSGTILLVESEGNIRLTTQLPAVHIAISGIEKIIPTKKELGIFIELLAASGTGQSLTTYTNILQPPLELPVLNLNGRDDKEREFHLVLVDNGRMEMRNDPVFREAMYCIRCSACMNVCANFQAVGGHSFGGEYYTGGIGGSWTMFTSGDIKEARFAELCTGCNRCVPNCPVKIDIPYLNANIKERLMKQEGGPSLQKKFFGNFAKIGKASSTFPVVSNLLSNLNITRTLLEKTVGLDKRRHVLKIPNKTLVALYHKYRKQFEVITKENAKFETETVLFADGFTNYNYPSSGMATIRVFDKLGIPIELTKTMDEGRAFQSQGMLDKAKIKAKEVAKYLETFVNKGKKIIIAEPSVLAMIRKDFEKLIDNYEQFEKLKNNSFDPIEYLKYLFEKENVPVREIIPLSSRDKRKIFLHNQCQSKSIGVGHKIQEFFEEIGFDVTSSTVECCGMAGSFGYKKDYYELSMNVGNDLIKQIEKAESEKESLIILANGISCRSQINDGLNNRKVIHPIELIDSIIK